MTNLRKATIRLAHQSPELRGALLPLLKKARVHTLIQRDYVVHPSVVTEAVEDAGYDPILYDMDNIRWGKPRGFSDGVYIPWTIFADDPPPELEGERITGTYNIKTKVGPQGPRVIIEVVVNS